MSTLKTFTSPILVLLFSITGYFASAQNTATDSVWRNWKPFIGQWAAENNGQGVTAEAKFSMTPDLNNKVLIRRIKMTVPDTGKTRAATHEGMLIISAASNANPSLASYYDDEGRTRIYTIAQSGSSMVLTSGKVKEPIYRMTFIPVADDRIKVKIESAPASSPKTFKLINEENWLRYK